jgi:phosphatidylserine/phosphatidylglycerophosphate/cardiolipin synthase-like enzyme
MKTKILNKKTLFGDLARSIKSAKNFVVIESYIWVDDHIGRKIVDALLRAADRGVKVVIREDISGSWYEHTPGRMPMLFDETDFSRFSFKRIYSTKTGFLTLQNLSRLGYVLYGFKKRPRLERNQRYQKMKEHNNIYILRGPFFNHGKTIIIDGGVAFVGGQCISKEYAQWTDYNMKIEDDSVVNGILEALLKKKNYIGKIDFFTNHFGNDSLHEKQKDFLKSMKGDIYIQMAYLGEAYLPVCVELVKNNNNVYFLVPKNSDTNHNHNMLFLKKLMQRTRNASNLHVALSDCMLHTKGAACPGKMTLGSNNFSASQDKYGLNEHNIFVTDPKLASGLLKIFKKDFSKNSRVYSIDELPKWSWIKAKRDQLGIFLFAFLTKVNRRRINAARDKANALTLEILGTKIK